MPPGRRTPSHILTISVPLDLVDAENPRLVDAGGSELQQAMAEALKVTMALVKLGTLGRVCNDTMVTLEDVHDPL